ncbi:hypothetical protein [Paenibacillus lautus]|uniref:hypothetical protein n=1 Tax=Paenibacillus TaxID=44249 RepID=UPI001C7CFB4F|nr:hypothetical protein [Paenibacillus lautus]MBX4150311.1 hypothetical protein [Paenibacillus lautus]
MMKDNNVKKIMITVNGKPVGNGLLIDKVTYAPIQRTSRHTGDKPVSAAEIG